MVTQEVTFSIKGFLPLFKEVIKTSTGSDEEIREALNAVCRETFHSDRHIVRDIILVIQH
jgi:hypothetical protein